MGLRSLLTAGALVATAAAAAVVPSLWPRVNGAFTYGDGTTPRVVSSNFTLSCPNANVVTYTSWLMQKVFTHTAVPPAAGAVTSVVVTVSTPNAPLALGVDESYTLSIPASGAITLTAVTPYGAYAGLQTLSQLITFDFDTRQFLVAQAPISITDAPSFKWRGLLVDTSRHFLAMHTLYRIIDSMTFSKMNVIHWHIVDWQALPVESRVFPKLWQGAWSLSERYTLEDVAAVVAYATARGIRVVPELDTPGHAGAMCVGYPSVCPRPDCTMPLNPASPDTLPLLNGLLQEWTTLFSDQFIHLGGDEVNTDCWSNTPAIVTWMTAHNLTTDTTYEYFVSQVDAMAIALHKSPIRWEEVWKHFRTDLDKQTILHLWLTTAALNDVVNNGYQAIYSVDGQYYLDALNEPWTSFYDVNPLTAVTNVTARQFLLGGEVDMWGETADTSDVQQTIWPRAAAAAERWWSGNAATTSKDPDVLRRLQDFRCLLMERGVQAAPVGNPTARQAPSGPGGCRV